MHCETSAKVLPRSLHKGTRADRNGTVLAQTSKVTTPQPFAVQSSRPRNSPIENPEDDTDLPQPSLFIAIEDETDGEDSFGQAAPRLSMALEDGEITGRSIEVARHVATESRKGQPPRESFLTGVPSDRSSDGNVTGLTDIFRYRADDSTEQHSTESDADEVGDAELRTKAG